MKIKLFAFALFTLSAVVVAYFPAVLGHMKSSLTPPVVTRLPAAQSPQHRPFHQPLHQPFHQPKVEVVFVLDTTGSMGGLIQAAKDKIWSIASTMASAQPAPEIHVGLVAYRDRGDQYVTQVVDLSQDLDSMYAALMDFAADGGGDTPEGVNEALFDAVNNISWSQDPDSYQVVFLVGDAPPHMDYAGAPQYPQILAEASRRGIVVNTIRCGDDPQTELQWQQMASLAQGTYFSVEQAGSAIAMATPFDEQLANLSKDLDDTRLYYGTAEERRAKDAKIAATGKMHAFASVAAKARRAVFNASESGAKNQFGDGDLLSDIAAGAVVLEELDEAMLPEPLQALAPADRNKLVEDNARRRAELEHKIGDLKGRRDDYLAAEVEASGDKEDSLDYRLFETVREQAQKKGLEYSAAPQY